MIYRQQLGNAGEIAVQNYLKKDNFKIIAHNYKSRWGEIDIIATKKEILAFVEVKTRKNKYFPISNVITYSKQQKIIRTAKIFIQKNRISDKVYRFDVATVIFNKGQFDITYIGNAFQDT